MSIVVKNLTHIYNEGMPFSSKALDNISFEIKDRDFVGLIGHTGSGKSTLIQHLNGILKPSSGDIYINDFKITDPDLNLTEIRPFNAPRTHPITMEAKIAKTGCIP